MAADLVCPDAALVVCGNRNAEFALLGRHDRIAAPGAESLESSAACNLFRAFSVIRQRGAGFLRVSIGRHAAGGRVPVAVLCAQGAVAGG